MAALVEEATTRLEAASLEDGGDDDEGCATTLYVISPAGKPVWCSDRRMSEEALSPTCGVATAVLALAADCGEEVVGLATGRRRLCILRRGELVLAAGGAREDSERALRRMLEYAHDAIVMVLTRNVHSVLKRSPNRDVRELLGSSTATILDGLSRRMDKRDALGPFSLLSGAAPALRFDATLRATVGHVLVSAQRSAAERCPSALYALCFCGGRLLGAAQPKCANGGGGKAGGGDESRRLRSVDVVLLLNFVESQKTALLSSGESWTPVCLPRFNDRGFLHAYVAFLDAGSGLCLALLAGDNAPETFATYRLMRAAIEDAFARDGVLEAAADAARVGGADLDALKPAHCLHFAVASRETGATVPASDFPDPAAPRPAKQSIAQCCAS